MPDYPYSKPLLDVLQEAAERAEKTARENCQDLMSFLFNRNGQINQLGSQSYRRDEE